MSHDRGCPLVQAHNQILSYNLYDDDGDGNGDGDGDGDGAGDDDNDGDDSLFIIIFHQIFTRKCQNS